MADDKIIEKIKNLLELAERAGSEEEASNAFAKAQAMMAKYAVEEDQLAAARGEKVGAVSGRIVVLADRDEIRKAKIMLAIYLARANRCQVVDGHGYFTVYGHEADTAFVEILWSSVLMQLAGERTRAWKEYGRRVQRGEIPRPESRFKFVTGFANAYVVRVGDRLREAAERDAQEQEKAAPGSALVLADRALAVKSHVDSLPGIRTVKVNLGSSAAAGAAGRAAGDRADLSGGRGNVGAGTRSVGSLLP